MTEDREDGAQISRRSMLKIGAGVVVAATGAAGGTGVSGGTGAVAAAGAAEAVGVAEEARHAAELTWLGDKPAGDDVGIVWGTPWPRGALSGPVALKANAFRLATSQGRAIPVQSWPLAYWPDGSLKWTGHAAPGPIDERELLLTHGATVSKQAHPAGGGGASWEAGAAPDAHGAHSDHSSAPIVVKETSDAVTIRTGGFTCTFPKSGSVLLASAVLDGKSVLENGRLTGLREESSPSADAPHRTEPFESNIEQVLVEQSGPVRGLVRIDGKHRSPDGRVWLPFTVRFALFAGSKSIRVMHTFTFDGDAQKDFIRGLGVRFDVPLRDELQNRHVRFVGDGEGVWGEAVRNIPGWGARKFKLADRFQDQLAGKPVPVLADMDARTSAQLLMVPAWNDLKLYQGSADHFDVRKRTAANACWLQADHGRRAAGFGYLGGVSGGVAFGLRDFWQRHPTALEINGATTDRGTVTVWLWSPDAQPMDLRHYSDHAHGLEVQYEDVQPGHSTPVGVARTSELLLWALPATPAREHLVRLAAVVREPPLLVCQPRRYHDLGLFGVWSLLDRSTPARVRLEDDLQALLDFYRQEIDRRQWYGFWNYGDVMHTYDSDRHVWRYDVGGYAWANSELVPDLWFWYAFLRSGRADLFRMAEAMTRHTSEVDIHHLGPFAKLGSRHNVVHWGDGSKEARISQALLRRVYYYLTADERTGDVMRLVVDADQQLVSIDPLREILPPSRHPTHIRSGPDWFALASNWMTEWERTGDTRWREKIVKGLDCIAGMPRGMLSGPAFGYDPSTATLYDIGLDLTSSYHLVTIMGGAEFVFELATLIDHPAWNATWLKFCELYNAPERQRIAALGPNARNHLFEFPVWHARLTAYAAKRKDDPALARRAWTEFLERRDPTLARPASTEFLEPRAAPFGASHEVAGRVILQPALELMGISTNHASQWSLNLIELLELVGDPSGEIS